MVSLKPASFFRKGGLRGFRAIKSPRPPFSKVEKLRYNCDMELKLISMGRNTYYTDLKPVPSLRSRASSELVEGIKPEGTVLVLNSKETNTEALAHVFRPVINTLSSMSQFSCESNSGNVVIIIVSLRRQPSYHHLFELYRRQNSSHR